MKTLEEKLTDLFVANGIATEDEIRLVCDINGRKEETFMDILYARTGYRNLEQLFSDRNFTDFNRDFLQFEKVFKAAVNEEYEKHKEDLEKAYCYCFFMEYGEKANYAYAFCNGRSIAIEYDFRDKGFWIIDLEDRDVPKDLEPENYIDGACDLEEAFWKVMDIFGLT